MIIWPFSDLHQEFRRDPSYGGHPETRFEPLEHAPASFDVVVAAGDIDVTVLRSLKWLAERFPGVPTIYTMGNHCAYSEADSEEGPRTIGELTEMGLELADRLGIHMLADSSVVIDGVRFAGGTLWTDMMTVGYGNTRSKMAEAQGRNGQNDYKHIRRWSTADPTKRKRFRPEDSIALHRRTRRYLEEVFATPHEGPTVAVTHHAPHPSSLDPAHLRMEWCDASNLSLVLEAETAPDLWLHGHIHGHKEYTVGRTRVVRNARGYRFDKKEDRSFLPSLTLEVRNVPVPVLGKP